MPNKKILLTGSHAGATAFALINEIKAQKLNWDIFWVGKKWADEAKRGTTLEYNSLPKIGVSFFEIESGRIQTKFTRYTISALLKIPFGFIQSLFVLLKVKPDIILSFGGASGALVSFWGFVLNIPVVVHEQTSALGRANKFSSYFAKVVAISRKTSLSYLKNKKTDLTGNPVSAEILKLSSRNRRSSVKTIFVTGGSRGSDTINQVVSEIIGKLSSKYNFILQVGKGKSCFFENLPSGVEIYEQIDSSSWPKYIERADILISRSGANIVSELLALKIPSILVPLPYTYNDEQYKNALYAQKAGLARIVMQDELTAKRLLLEIDYLVKNYEKIIQDTKDVVSPDMNASSKLIDLLKSLI